MGRRYRYTHTNPSARGETAQRTKCASKHCDCVQKWDLLTFLRVLERKKMSHCTLNCEIIKEVASIACGSQHSRLELGPCPFGLRGEEAKGAYRGPPVPSNSSLGSDEIGARAFKKVKRKLGRNKAPSYVRLKENPTHTIW